MFAVDFKEIKQLSYFQKTEMNNPKFRIIHFSETDQKVKFISTIFKNLSKIIFCKICSLDKSFHDI